MEEAPKHNPWPFIAVDAVLCLAALAIGYFQPQPLGGPAVFAVAALVFLGSVIAVIPFILNATRRQEIMLDERLAQIAALVQTTTTAADQLSIAASGLHGIVENAHKAVKHAEALPHKMQEKIHEFKEQLNEVTVSENEALSQEVNTLRASETERMESVVTTVRKLSSEFARLEAATRKNVNELTEALEKFSATANQASTEAATAISSARASAEKSMAAAEAASVSTVQGSLKHATTTLDAKLNDATARLSAQIERVGAVLDEKIAAFSAAAQKSERSRARVTKPQSSSGGSEGPAEESPVSPVLQSSASEETRAIVAASSLIQEPNAAGDAASASPISSQNEPANGSGGGVEHVEREATIAVNGADAIVSPKAEAPAGEEVEVKPAKKRVRRDAADNELMLGLDLPSDDPDPAEQGGTSAISADGATRLLVTSYIGIGNKLFVRGEGPGLSWEKGTPLQFVSIGKWRWETADATTPVKARILKNDQDECVGLGEITVEPGHQHEVKAKF